MKSDPNYSGPVIVSEGDSWFQYPFFLRDIVDNLQEEFAILSIGAAGDTMRQILDKGEYLPKIKRVKAEALLLSAGGNDLLGAGALANYLKSFEHGRPPEEYLLPSFDAVLNQVISGYRGIFVGVHEYDPHIQIFVHGYDAPIPREGKFLGKPMISKGIEDQGLQKNIAKEIMKRFNESLSGVVSQFPNVTYIDLRETVGNRRWNDEIHPNDHGFKDVADKFRNEIAFIYEKGARREAKAGATEVKARSKVLPTSPKGFSINIGLNEVDPDHYAGWTGALNACEYDAEDMHSIAHSSGYQEAHLVRTKQATRSHVISLIRSAQSELNAGDILMLSYSGHGGQSADFGRDERDGIDETWCLYDGQLIDDELYELWFGFRQGVRILLISDSCHSGTIYKYAGANNILSVATGLNEDSSELKPKRMPVQVANLTFRKNREFYKGIHEDLKARGWNSEVLEDELDLKSSVRLLSGCMDNQYSYDGIANGQFTSRLLGVWNDGKFKGDYKKFHRKILDAMPENQSPQHNVIGQHTPYFDRQKPFQI